MDDEQYFIDREIGKATLECLDESRGGAELIVDSGLQRITYTFHRKPDGKWKFEADLVYPEDSWHQ